MGSMLTSAARCSVGGTAEHLAALVGHRNYVSSADGHCVWGGVGGEGAYHQSPDRVRACACIRWVGECMGDN